MGGPLLGTKLQTPLRAIAILFGRPRNAFVSDPLLIRKLKPVIHYTEVGPKP